MNKLKEIEKIVKEKQFDIFKLRIDGLNPNNSIFTSSEIMDINEMIEDNMSINEIVDIIKQW